MGNTAQRQLLQVLQSQLGSPWVQASGPRLSSKHGGNFEIDELRRGEKLTAQSIAGCLPVGCVVA